MLITGVPVVLTGSQLPLDKLESDARSNLVQSIKSACGPFQGYAISFGDVLLQANRTIKYSSHGFNAFQSPREEPWAKYEVRTIFRDDIPNREKTVIEKVDHPSGKVALYTVTGNDDNGLFTSITNYNPLEGIVVEGLGGGNIPDFISDTIQMSCLNDLPIVITSPCPDGVADLEAYEVGQKVLDAGAISGKDMTTESAYFKLVVATGKYRDHPQKMDMIRRYMDTRIAGEFSEEFITR